MEDKWMPKCVAEFIGTFGLIFMGAGSIIMTAYAAGASNLIGIAFAHGLAIALGVAATGHISGGHLNPAVTAAFMATRRIGGGLGIAYIVSQLLGGFVAALFLRGFFPTEAVAKVSLGTPSLGPGVGFGQGTIIEVILTFFLVFVIFGTAVHERGPRAIAPLCIGLAVTMDILAGGPLTGASMNPARTFGPALAYGFWENHLVYWVGPIVGGILAALVSEGCFLKRS